MKPDCATKWASDDPRHALRTARGMGMPVHYDREQFKRTPPFQCARPEIPAKNEKWGAIFYLPLVTIGVILAIKLVAHLCFGGPHP